MNIILWIVFGAVVGWVSSLIMKTNESQGLLMDIAIGIVGALVGGFLVSLLGLSGITGFNIYSFAVAILGSVMLIGLSRTVRHA